MSLLQEAMDACAVLTRRVEHLEYDKVTQALEITKLKRKVKKLEKRNKVRVLKLIRLQRVGTSQRVETSERVETSDDTVMDDESNQGRMIAEMDQDEDKEVDDAEEHKVDGSAQDQRRQAKSQAEIYKIDMDHANKKLLLLPVKPLLLPVQLLLLLSLNQDHVKRKAKEDPAVKRYQAMKRKPQTEAQARKNMMMYLKNVVGFKMDYFKGIEDLEALWSLVKERFSTAKPKNFFDDFLLTALGAMFEMPDAHAQIWKNQRSVHGQAKVKSWKLLKSCGVQIITFATTQLILLVERRYTLSRFTLDQMLNVVRLQVEEENEEHVAEEVATNVVPPTPTSPLLSSPVLDICSALVLRVEGLETANAAQQLEIVKLKARVKQLERLNKVKLFKLRRLKKVGTSQCVESSDDVEN
nr:hypothetical protein [Tanacetum cinerariifolium]